MSNQAGGFMSEEDDVIYVHVPQGSNATLSTEEYANYIVSQLNNLDGLTERFREDTGYLKAQAGVQQADRFNDGKSELSYVFDAPLAMEGLANRFSLGAKKYSRDNWKKGLPTVQVIDSLLRHISAYQNGEVNDPDGGLHVDAIVWNAVVLSEQFHRERKLGS